MRKIKLKEALLFGSGLIALASCGGGGGSGNGVSNNGYYQLVVQAVPSTITPSVDISNVSVPFDQWTANVILNSQSGAEATSGVITSASICFSDTTLAYQCMPVSFTNPQISINGTDTTSFTANFYKYGATALATNPLQNMILSNVSSTISAYLANLSSSSIASVSSQTTSYEPDIQLSTSVIPGSVVVTFGWTVPAQVSSTTISTTSGTSTTSTSSGTGVYAVSGQCVDNKSGSFNTISSYSTLNCSGSINYNVGTISNFTIADTGTITESYTTTMISNTSSQTIITTYTVSPSDISNYEYSGSASIYISYISSSLPLATSGSVVSAYIPSSSSVNKNGVYVMNTFKPIGILVVENESSSTPTTTSPTTTGSSSSSSSSSGPISSSSSSSSPNSSSTSSPTTTPTTTSSSIFYQCSSSIPCSYSNGIFSITLPAAVPNSYSFYVVGNQLTEYSFNPLVTITNYTPIASIPYTFTVNITLNTGQTEQATYNGTIDVFAP